MKKGVNKVILIGNVGDDPDLRHTGDQTAVVNLTMATGESWKDKNTGDQVEKTEWHRVVFFKRLAEIVADHVRKGSKIYVEGRLQTRSYEKDGRKLYTTEIVAHEMQMLDKKSDSAPVGSASNPATPEHKSSQQPSNFDNFDDDIPF